jgi:hypothetical protein
MNGRLRLTVPDTATSVRHTANMGSRFAVPVRGAWRDADHR